MAKIQNPTKVITGVNTRWSYANVWDAKEHQRRRAEVQRLPHHSQVRHRNR